MLKVKKLHPDAKLPTRAHPEEDLGWDLFALEDTQLGRFPVKVRTGIAARYTDDISGGKYGLMVKDRSSMATKGVYTHAGICDVGYTGEILIVMSVHNYTSNQTDFYQIKAGDKIAQILPLRHLSGDVVEVEELGQTIRANKGFGSTGA